MSATPISPVARMLGFAGLLPQLAALLLVATTLDAALGTLMALAYAVVILSFIGGIWWGFAMRRGPGSEALAVIAVVPTLIGSALVLMRIGGLPADLTLIALGCVLLLTLLVDRRLVRDGDAPPGWMGLRVPLSMGLGALTILAGIFAPPTVTLIYAN